MKAVIFARVSSREQEEGYSIDAQVARLNDYCKRKNLEIIETYKITESSTRGERVQFYEVIDFVKKHPEPIAIVADTIDRVQRGFTERVVLDDLRKKGKIEIHFYNQNLILNKDSKGHEITQWNIGVLMAESYVLSLSDNVKRSLQYKRNNGCWTHDAPIGYINCIDTVTGKSTVKIDKERAYLVKKAFETYSSGASSLGDIKEMLRSWGLTNKRTGTPLSKAQVHNMLKNSFYYGLMVIEDKVYAHKHGAIIDKATFDKCQEVMQGWHKQPFKHSEIPFVFRGLIKCGYCGCTISTQRKKEKYNYLSCSKYKGNCDAVMVKEEIILEQVKDIFKKLVIPQNVLDKITVYLQNSLEAKKDYQKNEIELLQKEASATQRKLDTLLEMRLSQSITTSEYDKKARELKQRQLEINERQKFHLEADEKFTVTLTTLLDLASRAYELFESSKVEQKRRLINFLLYNLELKGEKLTFSIRKPFDMFIDLGNCSEWSGRLDSNQRPSAPKADALTGLRYSPTLVTRTVI